MYTLSSYLHHNLARSLWLSTLGANVIVADETIWPGFRSIKEARSIPSKRHGSVEEVYKVFHGLLSKLYITPQSVWQAQIKEHNAIASQVSARFVIDENCLQKSKPLSRKRTEIVDIVKKAVNSDVDLLAYGIALAYGQSGVFVIPGDVEHYSEIFRTLISEFNAACRDASRLSLTLVGAEFQKYHSRFNVIEYSQHTPPQPKSNGIDKSALELLVRMS